MTERDEKPETRTPAGLPAEAVRAIRSLKGQKTQAEVAAMFGVTDATVRDIYTFRTWRNL